MSVADHPNLHAAGLTIDIIESVQRRVRGKASDLTPSRIMALTTDLVIAFVAQVDERLDEEVARK
jgi:hypothetical protein